MDYFENLNSPTPEPLYGYRHTTAARGLSTAASGLSTPIVPQSGTIPIVSLMIISETIQTSSIYLQLLADLRLEGFPFIPSIY